MRKATLRPASKAFTGSWESLCRNCGLCCHEKDYHRGWLYIRLRRRCEHLSGDKRCIVYPDRFRVCKDCRKVGLFNALFTPYLPSICGYVRRYRPWRTRKAVLFL